MAAEYERLGQRLYDFSKPIPEARIDYQPVSVAGRTPEIA